MLKPVNRYLSAYGGYLALAHLSGALLSRADLSRANLTQADLSAAKMWGANLNGAHLNEADLTGAEGLTQEQVDEADGDRNTKLPKGLNRPSSWPQ
jgi:uncharacterized protein YjbI with pentapeptide repeats